MKLNRLEFLMMNNPLREFIQEFEAKELMEISGLKPGKILLEIGCGSGNGTKLIMKYFKPRKVYAIDLDERMIEKSIKRNAHTSVEYSVGDCTGLRFTNSKFDAVIIFGALHHIPAWKKAISEISRVLKPGGRLIIEDYSRETFKTGIGKLFKRVLKHPYKEMYTVEEFVNQLSLRFRIRNFKARQKLGLKYFILAAEKK